jgi:hypothetical protein
LDIFALEISGRKKKAKAAEYARTPNASRARLIHVPRSPVLVAASAALDL